MITMASYIKPGHAETMIRLDSSSSNIPTAYSTAAGSAIRKNGNDGQVCFAAVNYATDPVAISLDGGVTDSFICPGANSNGPGVCVIENVVMSRNTSIRSLSGSAISTGVFYLSVW